MPEFKLFNLTPPDDESYETLAGYVMDKLGRFAEVGDKFTSDNLYFEVLSIEEFFALDQPGQAKQ